jgi:hypothetical protein
MNSVRFMCLLYPLTYLLFPVNVPAFSIQALLSAPNPDDPLSDNIAKHWKANEVEAVETGKKPKLTNSQLIVLLCACHPDNNSCCVICS